jgi:hypothetical protein
VSVSWYSQVHVDKVARQDLRVLLLVELREVLAGRDEEVLEHVELGAEVDEVGPGAHVQLEVLSPRES